MERFFFLDDADRAWIEPKRRAHNRLGFAVQMTTVRFLGVFLDDPTDVPAEVVDYLAEQLGVADALEGVRLCVPEQVHRMLRSKQVFAKNSSKWGDPRTKLLDGEAWEKAKPTVGIGGCHRVTETWYRCPAPEIFRRRTRIHRLG